MNAKARIVVAVAAVVALSECASAKTCVWTGAGQTVSSCLQLFDSANWEGNVTPEDGDTLYITTKSGTKISVNLPGYTFENIVYTNTYATEFIHNGFTLTGTESKFTTIGKNLSISSSLNIAEGARVEFCQESGSIFQLWDNAVSGSGEIVVTGSRDSSPKAVDQLFAISGSQPNFHGTWNFYRPVQISRGVNYPFGADDATVNVYGENGEANQSGRLHFYGSNTVSGEINFFHTTKLVVSTTSTPVVDRIVTFNGNVTYSASSGHIQMDISVGINSINNTSGFVFKKDLVCLDTGYTPWMNIYTYNRGTYYFEVRGEFRPNRNGSQPFIISTTTTTADNIPPQDQTAELYMYGPLYGGHTWRLVAQSYHHFHTMAPNILPTGSLCIGYNSRDKLTPDSYLDLHGYDQKMASFYYREPQYVTQFAVQSTGRPATLMIGNNEGVTHVVPPLRGKVSLYGFALSVNNGSHSFTNYYETSGWIGTEKNTLVVDSTASFPNLGGIECTGAGSVIIRDGATLNPNMTIDAHDMTGGKIRITTGVNLDVKHVFAESVDQPAGVYCRTGAGIEGATEVAWLNKTSGDTDTMKGTVTVAAHDPVWIWTGNGSSSSFTDAANWGANASPDLTNPRLTLNLKNAAGKADMVVPLDGTVEPAGAFNCGDYSKECGVVTFGGSGALVLGDAGASSTNDLKMVFTESTSFTWNGAGTLYLTGRSTSTGTLTVNSGKVIMDYAGWAGKVVVASGAELIVNTSCGNGAFDAGAEFRLDGKLTIGDRTTAGDEISLSVDALYVGGALARNNRTYGSAESAAVRKDSVHFGGPGTIVSALESGMLMILR